MIGETKAIVLGGLAVGVLDLGYAIVVYSPSDPILIPQTIAGGILGAASYHGGAATAALGVVLHFFIAFSVAAVYVFASRKLDVLTQHPFVSGICYGGLVYAVMHGIVLPLSAHHGAIPPIYVITEFIEHWFFVGLPPAYAARIFLGAPSKSSSLT